MTVSRGAVRQFLRRKLKDSTKVKLFTPAALDEKLSRLEPPPIFHTEPRLHQKACFLLGAKYPSYFFLLDPGLGKTKLTLDLIRWRKRRKDIRRALVLVPGLQHVQSWVDEGKIHCPKLAIVPIDQTGTAAREAAFYSESHVTVITYAGFLRLMSRDKTDKKGRVVKGWAWDKKKVEAAAAHFDMLVLDESQQVENGEGLTHRTVWQLRRRMEYFYALTGTPIGSDPEGAWGQFFLIDKGESLGETMAMFHAAFYEKQADFWNKWGKFVFREDMAPVLHRMMRNRAIRYEEQECNDLPPYILTERKVTFSPETWAYYEKLTEELKDAKGNFRLVDNVFFRMRGLIAGYLAVRDPEGDRVEVVFKKNPKMDALIELLREIPKKRKVLIFCHYKITGKIICERLKEEGIKHLRLYSGTADKKGIVGQFSKGKYRCLVGSSAAGLGLNLQAANHVIFYEPPTDPRMYKQEWKRAHRTGQTRRVFVWHLLVQNSIDMKIIRSLKIGEDLFQLVVNGKAKL